MGSMVRRPSLITKGTYKFYPESQEMVRCERVLCSCSPPHNVPVSSLGASGGEHMAGLENETEAQLSVFSGVLQPQCA